jgi:glycine dehydrogenase subunit 1
MSVMYMAAVGGTGIRELAALNRDKAEYLKNAFAQAGLSLPFSAPTFNEFVVKCPAGFDATYRRLIDKKIVAGLPLVPYYPELSNHYLFCVTETSSREDLDQLVTEVRA